MGDFQRKISRRDFIMLSSYVVGSLTAGCGRKEQAPAQSYEFPEDVPYAGFRMGVQSWCFRDSESLDTVIEYLHSLGLAHVEIAPSVHLPVETPLEEVKAVREKFAAAGITVDSFGVVRIANEEQSCRRIFDYGKTIGALNISVMPQYDALPLLDRLCAEYGIPAAIHNHGPEDKLYARPEMYREHLAEVSSRVGLCVDTGHYMRSGVDPLAVIDEFADRVIGVHLKEMVLDENGRWVDLIVGRGKLDLVALVEKLKAIGFKGSFSLEYESEPENPVPPLSECLAEMRKACALLG
ncbi:MAG: sugar phosphate isomerase/epimerase [Deltaproteobacteria bacterium]|nr:sugar phosphate isomerase/epimerase [Deltaproteobacteria bacterium]